MTTGRVTVRAGNPDTDRKLAVETFVRYLNPRYDEARFDWMYRQNPHGPGRMWVLADPDNESVIGIAGAFPRRMHVCGRETLAWVLGDFCVSDAYRSMGPALTLQRACLAEIGAGAVPFCYDFPSSGMMAVYRRLGISPLGKMVRLSKVLRVEARLREQIASRAVTRCVGAMASLFLAPRRARRDRVRGLEISVHTAPFSDEFTHLYRRHAGEQVVMVERSAEYLNWRYLANPVHRHEVMTARQADRLLGYAIVRQEDRTATLVDLFAGTDIEMAMDLVHGVVALAWTRGLDAVGISLLESSACIPRLTRVGFRQRETNPVIVYAPQHAWPEVDEERRWLLLQGDRDS